MVLSRRCLQGSIFHGAGHLLEGADLTLLGLLVFEGPKVVTVGQYGKGQGKKQAITIHVACVASQNRSFFTPKPNGNVRYAGYNPRFRRNRTLLYRQITRISVDEK